MGSIWYHGTSEENANLILKHGFRPLTHFTWDLHTSLVQGGMWVFGVYFPDKDHTQYWEWRTQEHIPPERILYLRKFSVDCVYDNEKEDQAVALIRLREINGPNVVLCTPCKGAGQLNAAPKYGGWTVANLPIACNDCGGFGCLRPDGTRINSQ